jgi:small conductance mechanosensitive channel
VVCGIFVVTSRPFRVGDIIKVGRDLDSVTELIGTVEDITLRHTVIRDFANRRIIIPNSVINMEVITNNNIIDTRVRRILNINVAYEADVNRAIEIIREQAALHPFNIDGRSEEEKRMGEPLVMVRVIELGEYFVKIRAYVWARNFDEGFAMQSDLLLKILESYRKEGIEIPYPHRTIINKELADERISE